MSQSPTKNVNYTIFTGITLIVILIMRTRNTKRNNPDASISYIGLGSFIDDCMVAQNLHYYNTEELPQIVAE